MNEDGDFDSANPGSYQYAEEKVFLHEKSCIRVSLNWRNELSKEIICNIFRSG